MGSQRPLNPDNDGDDSALSPGQNQPSLLGTVRATDKTKRIDLDADGNLNVHVQKDSSSAGVGAGVLGSGAITNVTANSLSTVVTYTAPSAKGVVKIKCSGTDYAKFSLVLNTVIIEIQRSGPSRNVEFGPLALASSDILDVKVEHFTTGQLSDFEATIYGV